MNDHALPELERIAVQDAAYTRDDDERCGESLTELCIVCNERPGDPAWGDYCSGICYLDALNEA